MEINMRHLIDKLRDTKNLTDDEFKTLIAENTDTKYLYAEADKIRREHYGNKVFLRGLIEISNHCRNDCFYCGIRASNKNAVRYRLSEEEILNCCQNGYELGFRTFVMQGGEDMYFSDDVMCALICEIKKRYPECAVTLSLGERSYDSYKRMYDAGADRYLLRHESANEEHYTRLHPEYMSLKVRKECLFYLKKIGYQTGSGFMIGSPYQTIDNIVEDLRFLQELSPHMIGIGPYITHKETPFADFKSGTLGQTLKMISILRLMFPKVLLPATTALGTIAEGGREMGIMAGANVVMPNLSPIKSRKLYDLYENKICTGDEAAECRSSLEENMKTIGYEVVSDRGDAKM